jgi:predicted N-acetyltransferase YhbS
MEIRGMRESEMEEMIELLCLINRPDGHQRYTRYIREDSSYTWDQTRVVVVDGRIASTLRIWDRLMRIGSSVVRMGGIGGVSTHPEQRKKGYASAMMREVVDHMAKSGYDVGVLFSEIPFVFYRRVGWECVPQAGFRIRLRQAVQARQSGWQVEPFEEERDLEQVVVLHQHYNARQSGVILRPRFHWDTAPARIRDLLPTIVARRGDALGGFLNFLVEGEEIEVLEVAYDRENPDTLAALVGHLLNFCEEKGIKEIFGEIPHRHPLVDALVQGSAGDLSLSGKTSMMFYAVNLFSLMHKLLPELQARLDACGQKFSPLTLGFALNEQACALRLSASGQLEVTEADAPAEPLNLPGEFIWRLLLGESTLEQLESALQARGIALRPEVAALFSVLFPAQEMTFWGSDHF